MPTQGSHGRPLRRECGAGDLFAAAYTARMGDDIQLIRFNDTTRQRWRNGGGWTREIAIGGDVNDWDWRISVAQVEADGPFSSFPGIEREIVLLAGAGMQFAFDDGESVALTPESPRLRFDGARTLNSRLVDGPTRDFNLMWRRDRIRAELWLRPMVGAMTLVGDAGEISIVHLVSGQLQVLGGEVLRLAPGDSLVRRQTEVRSATRMEGAGSALFIRLASAGTLQDTPVGASQ